MFSGDIITGFIFKEDDDVFLGLFENGHVADFLPISDWDGIYDGLEETKIMVVEVKRSNGSVAINDLVSLEIGKNIDGDEFLPVVVREMLQDLDFPSEDTDMMFASYLTEAGKSN